MNENKCKARIWCHYDYRQCSRNIWQDGYCKQHHPDTVQAKKDKAQKEWDKKWNSYERAKEYRDRKEALYDKMINFINAGCINNATKEAIKTEADMLLHWDTK